MSDFILAFAFLLVAFVAMYFILRIIA